MLSSLIEIKTPEEIEVMHQGARITLGIITRLKGDIRVGMSTHALDQLVKKYIAEAQCGPAFKGYQPPGAPIPYPSYACWSLNEEVFHSPASFTRFVQKGDLVKIDLGLKYGGLYADCADTLVLGDSTAEKLALIRACSDAIHAALPFCVPGGNTRLVTKAIDSTIRKAGFFPAASYGGHSLGTSLHMAPHISNDLGHTTSCELPNNFIVCLEPAALTKLCTLSTLEDGWTVAAPKGVLSAHVERMVSVTPTGGVILK